MNYSSSAQNTPPVFMPSLCGLFADGPFCRVAFLFEGLREERTLCVEAWRQATGMPKPTVAAEYDAGLPIVPIRPNLMAYFDTRYVCASKPTLYVEGAQL